MYYKGRRGGDIMASISTNKNLSVASESIAENKTEDKTLIPKLVVNNSTTLEPIGETQKREVTTKVAKVKEPTVKTEKAKKEPVKKTSRKKPSTEVSTNARKTSETKTTTSKVVNIKTSLVLQYQAIEVNTETLIKKAKDKWVKAHKKSEKDIKSLELYIKPEEYSAYYVINGSEKGRVDL